VAKQYSDYARQIQETLDELHYMQEPLRLVTSPDECEALAREMRQRTDHLGSVLVGYHRQQALDAAPLQAEQVQLVSQWPKLLKYDGRVKVWVRTSQGLMCWYG
jgi:hypothetical protein